MKKKILWIEDQANKDVSQLAAPVYNDGNYELIVAYNISDAKKNLFSYEFDAVVVDIRLPSGEHQEWYDLYKRSSFNKINARLGLDLLYSILLPNDERTKVKYNNVPKWIESKRFGILSVESREELADDMYKLGISHFKQKKASSSKKILLELIEEILKL